MRIRQKEGETREEWEYRCKQDAYRRGLYSCPPPPVPCALWDEAAWIKFIDMSGRWL